MPKLFKKKAVNKVAAKKSIKKVAAKNLAAVRTFVPDIKILSILKKAVTKKNPEGFITPTQLGVKFGKVKPAASSWACARLRKLVASGTVQRNIKAGTYRLV